MLIVTSLGVVHFICDKTLKANFKTRVGNKLVTKTFQSQLANRQLYFLPCLGQWMMDYIQNGNHNGSTIATDL
jgi:hypothetical protein